MNTISSWIFRDDRFCRMTKLMGGSSRAERRVTLALTLVGRSVRL